MSFFQKKVTAILLVAALWVISFGGIHINTGKATLDVSERRGASYIDAETKEVKVSGGKMTYRIPKSFSVVETELPGVPGYQYKLNEIPETYQTAAEQLYVFYFESEKYLLYAKDAKNTAAVEMAIVENILPGEKVSGIVAGSAFPTASKHNADGTVFDYYKSVYTDEHRLEFVFTKDGDRGLGCLLYVFTADTFHKDDILYVMNSIRFGE